MTEYHPFRSAEAKEKCLAMFNIREKSTWPIKSESTYIATSYGKTFVRISGPPKAPPLVLLHGRGANSLFWSNNINELSNGFRTYAVDAIDDYGLSINTIPMKDSAGLIKWLDELFTGLGLEDNINLMGHSYGGWQTSQYALRYQNRLKKIILIAPACTIQPIVFQFYIRQILMLLPFRLFKESFFSWVDPIGKDRPNYKEDLGFMEMCMRCYKPNYSIIRPTVLNDAEIKSIKCPTLFLVGNGEKIYSPEKVMERLERIAPHFKKEIIPNAGHITILQSPSVNEKITAFLEQQDMT
jgi:pimeloyl-ACP methyl ester carboxylesterase